MLLVQDSRMHEGLLLSCSARAVRLAQEICQGGGGAVVV
jgi:hypothetical protein